MNSGNISRRLAVGVLGGGVLAAPTVARAFASDEMANHSSDMVSSATNPAGILQPLVPGSRLGRWVVVSIEPLRDGGITVGMRREDSVDDLFHVEVLARDTSPLALRPPSETRHFAVFVCNEGDGWLPTVEEHGLAAMTLGAFIERKERDGDAAGFATHAQRLTRFSGGRLAGR